MSKRMNMYHIAWSKGIRAEEISNVHQLDKNEAWFASLIAEVGQLKPFAKHVRQTAKQITVWVLVDQALPHSLSNQIMKLLKEAIHMEWPLNFDKVKIDLAFIRVSNHLDKDEIWLQVKSHIHQLARHYQLEAFVGVMGYGEAALNQEIFMELLRTFEDRFISAYWNGRSLYTVPTSIKRSKKTWADHVTSFILDFDYPGALTLMDEVETTPVTKAVEHLLSMMVNRFNFSFEDAAEDLQRALTLLNRPAFLLETERILNRLTRSSGKACDTERLVELFRQMESYLLVEDLSSFLIRFYRLREALFVYLHSYARVTLDEIPEIEKSGNVLTIIHILDALYEDFSLDGFYGSYFYLKSKNVAETLSIRNRSFIGHGREGLSMSLVNEEYSGMMGLSHKEGKKRFLRDFELVLRELGVLDKRGFEAFNRYLLQLIMRGQSTYETSVLSSME